jgi:DNA ligase-1
MSSGLKFSTVTSVFDKIEQATGRLVITQLFADLLAQATPSEASIICTISLGKLHPPHIGTQFNVAEKSLIPIIASLLDISDADVTKLTKKEGDFGSVLATGSWRTQSTLSVEDVYNALCDIEKMGGTGSQDIKAEALKKLMLQLTPDEAKYVVRMVIGKLRLGFSDMTIIDSLSWMKRGDKSLHGILEDAYNVCADIGYIAFELKNRGVEAVSDMHVKIGVPIRPAAAERLPTAKAIVEKIGHCVAQPKLDGFRLQVHLNKTKNTPEIHFYSRNLQDMSAMFPDLVKDLSGLPVETLICEGEAISYDPNTGSFLPFQETVKRKRKHGIEEAITEFPLKLFIFDILYLNGKELMSETHEHRREVLLSLFKKFNNDDVQPIEEVEITTGKQLEDYFLKNIDSGLEGLVVKRADSMYQPGKRNFNWIKLKRHEEGQLDDTIDCVILGYYAGKGKRASFGIGAFLVGVYNKKEDRFETVAKIGTGLKDAEWIELKKKCDAIAVPHKPSNVLCAKELNPDVWVAPDIVCVIRADEITMSPLHTAGKTNEQLGMALRFPRIMGYRDDKGPLDITQVWEIKELFDQQFSK